ncbi:MAG TPA: WD40 repeat domain-containing protein [Pseudonocardiaceae bacterium]|nr:WD40 repeat domain-containing protein [Pseudonocardiaceae bacterium]
MPRSVLLAVCAAIAGEPDAPSVEQVAENLDSLRFYLRTGADSDGSALYRFFHQGLADHLRGGCDGDPADVSGRVVDKLLATVTVVRGVRRWDLAEPYLLRHAVQHAADVGRVDELLVDPEFLVHADPSTLIPALDQADSELARLATAVYRVSAGGHPRWSADQRRGVLAVDAARYGAASLLHGLTSTRGPGRSRWRPRWATGGQVSTALRVTLTGHTSPVLAVACTQLDGHPIRPIAVTSGGDATVRIWDLANGTPIGNPLTGHTGPVVAVACTQRDGHPIAVTGSADATVRIWDLTTGTPIGDALTGHTDTVRVVACTQLHDRSIAVTGSEDATVRIGDLTTGTPIGDPLTGHTGWVAAVACTQLDDRPIAVTAGGGDATVGIWDLTAGTPIGDPLTGHTGAVTAVACTQLDNRPIAVTSGRDATVRIWDLAARRQVDEINLPTAVGSLALTSLGQVVAGLGWDIVVFERTPDEQP